MRTFLSILILSFFFSVDVAAQNPTRKMLYTFAPNEIMETGEHIIKCRLDGYRFALLTTDTLTQKSTLIFNGKRIALNNRLYDIYNEVGYLDVDKPDGYGFIYNNEKGYYVNRGGKIEGPYEYAQWRYEVQRSGGLLTYSYVLADRVYDNVDGKVRKSQGIFDLAYQKDGYHYIAVNGRLEPYDLPGNLYVSGDNYAYIGYKNVSDYDEVNYLWINGLSVDYQRRISGFALNAKGDYVYSYFDPEAEKNGDVMHRVHVVKNGTRIDKEGYYFIINNMYLTESGEVAYEADDKKLHLPEMTEDAEFDLIGGFTYYDGEHYAFYYEKDGKYYVRIKNQADKGPYDFVPELQFGSNGAFIYSYRYNNMYYVKTDKTEYGPFAGVYNCEMTSGDDYSFLCDKGSKRYHCLNGVMTEAKGDPYNGLSMDTDEHSFYSKYDYDYVVIDGQRMGNSAAFDCRYDTDKNTFVWYCIEGRELVIYEYALD